MAFERRVIHLDDDAATELAVLSSSAISDPRAIEASFTKLRIGGDAEGQLKLKDSFLDRGSVEIGQYIAFEYSTGLRWYLGRVEEVIEHSPNHVDISLYGMWSELNEIFPGGFAESNIGKPHRFQASAFNPNDPDFSYQTEDIVTQPDDLVRKLWELYIAPSSNVGYGVVEACVQEPGLDGFVLRGTESVAELLRTLAVMCNNASVGVDEHGLLYFMQPSQVLKATFQEGVDCEELQLRTDRSLLYNYMAMTGGYVYGANTESGFYRYMANFKQESSISQYGQRGLHVYLPWVRRNKDAETFSENFFARYARPTKRAEFKTDCQTALLKPQDGQIKVLDRNDAVVVTDFFDELKCEFNHCPIFQVMVGPEDVAFPESPEPDTGELGSPAQKGDGQPAPPGPIASQNIGTYSPPSSDSGVVGGGGQNCVMRVPNGVSVNGGGSGWNSPTSIVAGGGSFASCNLAAGASSQFLVAKNFGFTTGDVGDNESITGVKVRVNVKADASGGGEDVHELTIRLTTNGSTGVGSNKAAGAAWPTSATFNEYGDSSDLWGTSLTPEDVRSANFGVIIQAKNFGASANVGYVGNVSIEVCTEPAESSGTASGNAPVSSAAPSSAATSDTPPSGAVTSANSSDAASDDEQSSAAPSSAALSSAAPSSDELASDAPSSDALSSADSDYASSNSPSTGASSGNVSGSVAPDSSGGGLSSDYPTSGIPSSGFPGDGPNACGECNLPDTLYVRRASDDALIDTLSFLPGCSYAGATCGFGYGFVPGQGTTWYIDCSAEPGGTEEYQGSLDSCTGTLMFDGGAYYVSDV